MRSRMKVKRFLHNNGLSLVMFCMFLFLLAGQALTGFLEHNADRQEHGQPLSSFSGYLKGAHFWEAVFENWESEFLQMAAYVVLTVFLFQKGSSESKDPNEPHPTDEDPRRHRSASRAPWPVRKGGLWLVLYEHSLSLSLFAFFLLSFVGHMIGGAHLYNQERVAHGQAMISSMDYLGSARFWFESFQNWQSEFLAVFAIVFLSIWLRERGSPESKPVATPHSVTES
jgi:hypothetical protein